MKTIEQARADQDALAKRLAEKLYTALDLQVRKELGVLERLFSWQKLAGPPPVCDDAALQTLLLEELYSDVLDAVHGYTDWAAGTLVRSENFSRQRPPNPGKNDVARISETYGVTAALLSEAVRMMLETEQDLPFLGRMEEGALVPDRAELEQWKSLFDWSEVRFTPPPGQTS